MTQEQKIIRAKHTALREPACMAPFALEFLQAFKPSTVGSGAITIAQLRTFGILACSRGTSSLRLPGITSSSPKNSMFGLTQSATLAPPGQVSFGRRVIGR